MRIEKGVMVMKNGKAWGIYGWIAPENAPIHNPSFCRKPTDVTHASNISYIRELSTAALVPVTRTTTVTFDYSGTIS
jgi:hypothetical protein